MIIKPRTNRVVLKTLSEKIERRHGITMPNVEKDTPEIGEVLFKGPESDLKKGQKVVFNSFSAKYVRIEGIDYVFCEDEDILAVLIK